MARAEGTADREVGSDLGGTVRKFKVSTQQLFSSGTFLNYLESCRNVV